MSKEEVEQTVNCLLEQEPPGLDQIDFGGHLEPQHYDSADLMDYWEELLGLGDDPPSRGDLESLVAGLGYDSFDHFLNDSPGCRDEIVLWIRNSLDEFEERKKALIRSIEQGGGELPDPIR